MRPLKPQDPVYIFWHHRGQKPVSILAVVISDTIGEIKVKTTFEEGYYGIGRELMVPHEHVYSISEGMRLHREAMEEYEREREQGLLKSQRCADIAAAFDAMKFSGSVKGSPEGDLMIRVDIEEFEAFCRFPFEELLSRVNIPNGK